MRRRTHRAASNPASAMHTRLINLCGAGGVAISSLLSAIVSCRERARSWRQRDNYCSASAAPTFPRQFTRCTLRVIAAIVFAPRLNAKCTHRPNSHKRTRPPQKRLCVIYLRHRRRQKRLSTACNWLIERHSSASAEPLVSILMIRRETKSCACIIGVRHF